MESPSGSRRRFLFWWIASRPTPFIVIQLRFALFLLYSPVYRLFWLGTASAIALTIAAVILGQPRRA